MFKSKLVKTMIAVFVIFIIACSVLWSMYGVDHISFTQKQTREQIANHMPFVDERVLPLDTKITTTIQDVFVDFLSDNQIHVQVTSKSETHYGSVEMIIDIIANPIIDGRSIYFKPLPNNFTFVKVQFDDKAKKSAVAKGVDLVNKSKSLASKTKQFANKIFNNKKVTIVEKVVTHTIQKNVAKVRANSDKIRKTAQEISEQLIIHEFNRMPIKKIDGFIGYVVATGVTDVTVDDNEITVHFSVVKFAFILILLLMTLITVIALIANKTKEEC